MTTERFAWVAAQPPVSATAGLTLPSLCGCGQDLEGIRREHCTRCGVSLATAGGRRDGGLTL